MLRSDIDLDYLNSKDSTGCKNDFLCVVDLATSNFIRECLVKDSVEILVPYREEIDTLFLKGVDDMDTLYDIVFGFFDSHLSNTRAMELLNIYRCNLYSTEEAVSKSKSVESLDDLLILYGLMYLVQYTMSKDKGRKSSCM